jgi:hypothetical protein
MDAVDRLRRNASGLLHHSPISLNKRQVVEQGPSPHGDLQQMRHQIAQTSTFFIGTGQQTPIEIPRDGQAQPLGFASHRQGSGH